MTYIDVRICHMDNGERGREETTRVFESKVLKKIDGPVFTLMNKSMKHEL